jgi:hypothetical protein
MKDTKQTYDHLQKALSNMPSSFALKEVRYYILKAMQKLEHVTKDRTKSEVKQQTKSQTWNDMLMNGVTNSNTPKRTLDIINNMIGESKRKLEDLNNKKKKPGGLNDNLGEEPETLYN